MIPRVGDAWIPMVAVQRTEERGRVGRSPFNRRGRRLHVRDALTRLRLVRVGLRSRTRHWLHAAKWARVPQLLGTPGGFMGAGRAVLKSNIRRFDLQVKEAPRESVE